MVQKTFKIEDLERKFVVVGVPLIKIPKIYHGSFGGNPCLYRGEVVILSEANPSRQFYVAKENAYEAIKDNIKVPIAFLDRDVVQGTTLRTVRDERVLDAVTESVHEQLAICLWQNGYFGVNLKDLEKAGRIGRDWDIVHKKWKSSWKDKGVSSIPGPVTTVRFPGECKINSK